MRTMPRLLPLALLAGLMCLPAPQARGDDWPQWLGPRRDGVWREKGILKRFPEGGPKLVWRIPLGPGYTGPAVADGRVYVMDRQDPPKKEEDPCAQQPLPKLPEKDVIERILCLDAKTGNKVWEHAYPCRYRIAYATGPRTTPVVDGGTVYTLGAMGDLFCLDAKTGKVLWHKNLVKDLEAPPPFWGWAAHPLIAGDLLYCLVGGKGQAVAAFDKKTGAVRWKALTSEEVCYAPPVLIEAGGQKQLVVWLSDSINGLDPATGKVHWHFPYPADGKPQRPAVNIATPRFADGRLFVSSFYHGAMMLQLDRDRPAARVLWQSKRANPSRPDTINIVMGTPILRDGHVYGVCGFGQLRCLDAKTGKQVWDTFQATGGERAFLATAFLVENGGRTFLFNDQGDLIIARLTPKGYEEIDRTHLIDPSQNARGRKVVWCHPAFAGRHVFVRNDKEMRCVSLAASAE
jgi:outer membrane protein assembly factor BamB